MADKQSGTGAKSNTSNKPEGQGKSTKGNHEKTSDNNRSRQVKDQNKSGTANDIGR